MICSKCRADKEPAEFYWDRRLNKPRTVCKECHRAVVKARCKGRTPQQKAEYRRRTGEVVGHVPYLTRAEIERQGAEKAAARRERADAYRAALAAWKEWIEVRAPEWWLKAWKAQRRKRRLARLSAEEIAAARELERIKAARRYAANPAKERARARQYKHSHPEVAERSQGKRAKLAAERADGTLTPDVIRGLFANAKVCAYDGRSLTGREKSLDHLIPISRGGNHSIVNVVVCCWDCNLKKRARPFAEWVAMLETASAARATKLYRSRYGCEPAQSALALPFATAA